jgi:23S rRNA (uracil1939-C5)-methyltransferase
MRDSVIEHTVIIEKMAFGGAGVAHINGKVCFVPYTVVGDTTKIEILSEKKSFLLGKVIEIVDPSPSRVVPECPVFGRCGGCDWQHMEYASQLEAKEEIFAEILWRIGRVERTLIEPIAAATDPYGYRSRIQLKLRRATGETHIGFFMTGSHYVVDLPGRCAISCEPINRVFLELREMMDKFPEPEKIPQIDISVGDDGKIILIYHYIGDRRREVIGFLDDDNHRLSCVEGVFVQSGRKATIEKVYGLESISYSVNGSSLEGTSPMRLHTSRGGFSQVNYSQNNVIIDTVLQWLRPCGEEHVLDLYCGNGNFSMPLARFCATVTGFEDFGQSIRDAGYNKKMNNLTNAGFETTDVVAGVKKLIDAGKKYDFVLLDPPRTGAAETVKLIPSLSPEKILYISCDPPTLARDINFLKKMGYEVVKCRPIDMFPQTYHTESVTLLKKETDRL